MITYTSYGATGAAPTRPFIDGPAAVGCSPCQAVTICRSREFTLSGNCKRLMPRVAVQTAAIVDQRQDVDLHDPAAWECTFQCGSPKPVHCPLWVVGYFG